MSDFYRLRNRLVFTRRYFPWALPTVYLGLVLSMINRICHQQWGNVGMILQLMLGLRGRGGPRDSGRESISIYAQNARNKKPRTKGS